MRIKNYSFLFKPKTPKLEIKIKEKKISNIKNLEDESNPNTLLELKEQPFSTVDEFDEDELKYKEESTFEDTSK
jgi:hypothetical protein